MRFKDDFYGICGMTSRLFCSTQGLCRRIHYSLKNTVHYRILQLFQNILTNKKQWTTTTTKTTSASIIACIYQDCKDFYSFLIYIIVIELASFNNSIKYIYIYIYKAIISFLTLKDPRGSHLFKWGGTCQVFFVQTSPMDDQMHRWVHGMKINSHILP